jgi:hypothetical protein
MSPAASSKQFSLEDEPERIFRKIRFGPCRSPQTAQKRVLRYFFEAAIVVSIEPL